MEQNEYRAHRRERKTTLGGSTAAGLGVADMWLHSETGASVLNWIYDGIGTAANLDLVGTGDGVAIGGGVAAIVLARLARYRRTSAGAERRRLYSSAGWMSTAHLWDFTGRPALVREAAKTRPGMTRSQRVFSRTPSELGVRVGTAVSGASRWVRGRSIYSSFEHGLLVLGEPGSWKSAFLADKLLDFPGAAVVTSTKTELWDATAEIREHQRGPVWVFDPYAEEPHADEYVLRWNLVAGCREIEVAMRRAEALMSAAAGEGLKGADFWAGRGRNLMTALLAAADYGEKTLRAVGVWLQTEKYEEPLRILKHAAKTNHIEGTLIGTLDQMVGSSAKAASGSAAQTASQVLEFLSNPKLADPLCPDQFGRAFDFDAFLREQGTVYMVTGESPALSPIVASFAAEMRESVKRYKRVERHRLDPPLGNIYDEAHLTVPSVPVHDHAAEMRSFGVWHLVATQNYAQIVAKWGADEAKTMRTCLQTHVVLAAHDQDDREYLTRRIGQYTQHHMKTSTSTPNTVATRLFGNPLRKGVSESRGTDPVKADTFPAVKWSELRPGQAVVIPNKGLAAVVSVDHGLIRAERMLDALHADRDAASAVRERFLLRRRRAAAAEAETAAAHEGATQ